MKPLKYMILGAGITMAVYEYMSSKNFKKMMNKMMSCTKNMSLFKNKQ